MVTPAELLRLLLAAGRPDLARALCEGSLDDADVKIRECMTLEKFDHTGETPQLVERLRTEDGQIVSRETFPLNGG